jgi:hypothetical protein
MKAASFKKPDKHDKQQQVTQTGPSISFIICHSIRFKLAYNSFFGAVLTTTLRFTQIKLHVISGKHKFERSSGRKALNRIHKSAPKTCVTSVEEEQHVDAKKSLTYVRNEQPEPVGNTRNLCLGNVRASYESVRTDQRIRDIDLSVKKRVVTLRNSLFVSQMVRTLYWTLSRECKRP